jgi:sugar O-acyltransferase (sialic acid O-acetyltransferase NeuD family)
MKKKKLLIFPFNGNGIEAVDCLDFDKYDFVGFVDDDEKKTSLQFDVFPRSILDRYEELLVLAVPGSPISYSQRENIISALNLPVKRYATVVHPGAHIGRQVHIGYNCLIMAGVVITSNARLNNHICVLPNSVIHHDVVIGDYTLIGSNVVIAGGTAIGKSCYVGSGTNVINGIEIGDHSLIGLGSNVVKTTASNSRIAGNPARTLGVQNSNKTLVGSPLAKTLNPVLIEKRNKDELA